jgi:hypothetical protein
MFPSIHTNAYKFVYWSFHLEFIGLILSPCLMSLLCGRIKTILLSIMDVFIFLIPLIMSFTLIRQFPLKLYFIWYYLKCGFYITADEHIPVVRESSSIIDRYVYFCYYTFLILGAPIWNLYIWYLGHVVIPHHVIPLYLHVLNFQGKFLISRIVHVCTYFNLTFYDFLWV